MIYKSPMTTLIKDQHIIRNQGSEIVPLNPNCDDSTDCPNAGTFVGTSCFSIQNDLSYDVHYFIPNLTCLDLNDNAPCTVKVNGNILSCIEEHSDCVDSTCNNQIGSIIRCSGIIPNLNSCKGLEASVECTSATDSDTCLDL